ncbi:hypothetical protein KJ695_03240 [Patescibacteria group bacterium]|nr:hypothetical protein [Patescibacteria group bacterium]MBU4056894.1 hypothetical protein [Patescibacteria group bacterium]
MERRKLVISDGGPCPDNSKARKIVENLNVLAAKVFLHADWISAEDKMKILQIAKRTGLEISYPVWIDKENFTEKGVDLIVDDDLVQEALTEIASNIDYYISSEFSPDEQDMKDAETLSEIINKSFS